MTNPHATATHSYATLTDENFREEVLESKVPVLVDFWAPWCGPCRAIAPVIEQLAAEYDGRAKVGKLNVDENPLTAQRYGLRSIPTMLLFSAGDVAGEHIGLTTKRELAAKLDGLLQTS
jgi:thioredoxin 1